MQTFSKFLLKKQTGVIQDISSYCPLDLFSGDDVRMRRSLYNLLSSPQNNLQVFQDRKTVYKEFDHLSQLKKVILNLFPQSQNLMETFVDLLCQALLHSFPVLNKQTNDSTTIESSGICDFHKESSNNDTIQTGILFVHVIENSINTNKMISFLD